MDVYGKCGPLDCPPPGDCYSLLDTSYKFYLAFENSLCRDYVTEKFYRTVQHRVIPVTYNGADMHNLAPYRSYINTAHFSTVKGSVKQATVPYTQPLYKL